MKYKIKVYSIWEYGQRKDAEGNPHQEDCTFPLPADLKDSDRTFILCDGMGGHDAGEVASATVCETMGNSILNDDGHDPEGTFTDEDLHRAIAAAFAALDLKDSGAEKKMGTTMTFLKLHDRGATVAHMGDSRVYQIRPGKDGTDTRILFQTEDHSLVNDLVKIGELTPREARTSKQKNVITRAMQPNMDRKPKADISHITDIRPGDFFYMCSDGMLEQEDMDNGDSLRNIFSNEVDSAEKKVEILTGATKHNKDNHTALIIHILDVEGQAAQPAAAPATDFGLVEGDETPQEKPSAQKPEADTKKNSCTERRPKSRARLIALFIILALIAGAGIVGYKYLPSRSDNPQPAPPAETPAKPDPKPTPKPAPQPQSKPIPELKPDLEPTQPTPPSSATSSPSM